MSKDIGKFTVMGNKARREKLSAEIRSSIASLAAKARWAKHNEIKNHECSSTCICTCGVKFWKHSQTPHDFDCQSTKSVKNI